MPPPNPKPARTPRGPRPASTTPQRTLDRLREFRVRPDPDLALTNWMGFAARELKARAKQAGGLGSAWAQSLPPDLLDRTEILTVSRGVLKVRCDDSATLDAVNHWLRAGGQQRLVRLAPSTLTKVRLTL